MVTLAAAGLAGWVGYRNEVAAVTAAGSAPLTFRSAARHLLTPKTERDAMKRLEALRQRAGRGSLTPAEQTECWEIIRNFTEDQVKASLAEMPDGPERGPNFLLTGMLFHRWAQLAPETAARESMKEPYTKQNYLPRHILAAWLSRDREAAVRWVDAQGSDPFKNICGLFMGRMLVREDPATALARAEKLHPSALGSALRMIAEDMAATAESRKTFLALQAKYGGTKEWDRAVSALGNAAVEQDPENLLATVKGTGLPPEKSLQYRNRAIDMLLRQNPVKVMDWTMDPASGVSGEKRLSVFRQWAANDSKAATSWAADNGRHGFIAEGVKEDTMVMLRYGWQYGSEDGWAGAVPDRYEMWRTHDPAGAETWLRTMPSDVRKFLTERKADATK